MKKLIGFAVLFVLANGFLTAGKKEVAVVAIVAVDDQSPSGQGSPLPVTLPSERGKLPTIDEDAKQDSAEERLIIADPQVTSTVGYYGHLSFLIRNDAHLPIGSGRIVLRQYLDIERTKPVEDNAIVYLVNSITGKPNKIMPGQWMQTANGLLRQKVKAFDILAIECFFVLPSDGAASVLDRPRTKKFTHEFKPGEAKSIIAKSFGRAKVE